LALRDSYHCFAVDLRGHGDSQWAETYQIDSHAGDVRAVANVLGLRDFVLIGMSLGGLVALRYAELNRDLRALVIVDIGPDAHRSEGSKRIQDLIDTAELDAVEDFVELSLKFNPRRNRKMLHASLMHNLRQLPNGKWTWKYDRRQFTGSAQLDRLLRDLKGIWEKVSEIGCPTLIVRGSDSDILSADVAKHLAERFSDGTYAEVPSAGHTVQGDNPAAFVTELRTFLRLLGN
jgi:pimeloyl-ACP methyl ester carboxylesterase